MKIIIRALFYSLPLCIGITMIIQMVVANELAVLGNRVAHLETRSRELKEQNEVLTQYLAQLSSIRRVETQARAMGMKEGNSFIAFDSNYFPVALKR